MRLFLRILTGIAVLPLLIHCGEAPASAPGKEEAKELGPVATMIRNPVDVGNGEVDTANIARITFAEDPEYRFGDVKEGTVVKHDFRFTNTGDVPLLITKARSTCGCTVPSYPQTPIAPGEVGTISVAFDTNHKYGRQRKPVTISANTYPANTVVYMDGIVIND